MIPHAYLPPRSYHAPGNTRILNQLTHYQSQSQLVQLQLRLYINWSPHPLHHVSDEFFNTGLLMALLQHSWIATCILLVIHWACIVSRQYVSLCLLQDGCVFTFSVNYIRGKRGYSQMQHTLLLTQASYVTCYINTSMQRNCLQHSTLF